MGHIRLGRLPQSRRWREVVAAIADGAAVDVVAAKTARASEGVLKCAWQDDLLLAAVRLLCEIPQAARGPEFIADLERLGVETPASPTLLQIAAGLQNKLDQSTGVRELATDLGEIASSAAVSALVEATSAQLPSLFEPSAADVQKAVGSLARGDRFGLLMRTCYGRRLSHRLRRHLPLGKWRGGSNAVIALLLLGRSFPRRSRARLFAVFRVAAPPPPPNRAGCFVVQSGKVSVPQRHSNPSVTVLGCSPTLSLRCDPGEVAKVQS